MKFNFKTIVLLALLVVTASSASFANRKDPATYYGDCNQDNPDIWYKWKSYVDVDGDGQWDHYYIQRCNNTTGYVEMKKRVSVIAISPVDELDPASAAIRLDMKFNLETLLPSGIKVERIVTTWQDSTVGEIGIEYQSIEKDANNEILSFFTETKIPNPFNAEWSFADVHGQIFTDPVRGSMVNELRENGTEKLVGIQYFPNGGNPVTIFFYPKN
ncbi:MAG: hypothetical protein ACM3U1_05400 [Chloroflexota bacterium]